MDPINKFNIHGPEHFESDVKKVEGTNVPKFDLNPPEKTAKTGKKSGNKKGEEEEDEDGDEEGKKEKLKNPFGL